MAAESNIIGEVGLLVKPVDPNAQFQAGVDRIIKQLEKNAQFQVKAAGMENIQEQANGLGNAFAQAAVQAAGVTAAIFGIRAAVEGTISKFSGLFDQLAQAKAGFSSILKSEALGNNLLDDIREFARVSPFVTQELVNYSQQLLGVGENAKDIIPLLKSTGDILSSVGGDTTQLGRVLFTLTQIKSIGSLKGQDTLQLQNSLIPITKYLSEYLGKTSKEIVQLRENGLITADQVFAAINSQGEKVKGAMDKATRNIVGARAILSDTVTILLQNQPVLNKIFENMYKGILALSNFIGTTEFQDSFARFFDGVDKVYESLKPLFASLGDLGQSATIQSLQIFGTVLETIGNALSSLPTGVLEVFGRVLAAMAVLRAPLLLLNYATSIQTVVRGIVPAVSGLSKLGTATTQSAEASRAATAAYEAEAVALKKVGAAAAVAGEETVAKQGFLARHPKAAGRVGQAALVGAAVAGGALSQSDNTTAKFAGSALTYGAIGGSVGGPLGAAVGVEFGLLSSYLNQQKEAAQKWAKELTEIGKQGATDFIEAIGQKFGEGINGDTFKAYGDKIKELRKSITLETQKRDRDIGADLFHIDGHKIGVENDAITLLQTQLTEIEKQSATTFDPTKAGLKTLVDGLDKTEAAYAKFTSKQPVKGWALGPAELDKAAIAAKEYGFALEDLADPEKVDGILSLIQNFDHLTTTQQNATKAATAYNTALEDAKKAASAIFDPEEKKLQGQVDSLKAVAEAEAAQHKFGDKQDDLNARLAAKKGQEAKYAERLAYYTQLGYASATALYRANIEGEEEYQRLLKIRTGDQNAKTAYSKLVNANLNDPSNNDPNSYNLYDTQEKNRQDQKKRDEEAKKLADEAAKKAQEWADTMKGAASSLADKLSAAANEIADAAQKWVGSIKERTQYETAVSVGRATKNAQRQVSDLTELSAGLVQLRARGLSEDAIKSLGIDNVSDLKQVRKLLRGTPGELGALSGTVSELNKTSTDLAAREEDKRFRDNVTSGILDAAKTLGVDLSKDQASGISGKFDITLTSDPEKVAAAIIAQLSAGKTGR